MKRYVVREYNLPQLNDENESYFPAIGIGVRDSTTNIILPSPLSNFIKTNYRNKGKSLSSQRNSAYAVTRFLNYVDDNVKSGNEEFKNLRIEGLSGLSLIHGSKYISSLSMRSRKQQLNSKYINNQIHYLIDFYFWLKKQTIIKDDFELSYKNINRGDYSYSVPSNPFDDIELGTIFPRQSEHTGKALSDFGRNRYHITVKLINIARMIEPEIALGICFQFFGGLRRSEVINLTLNSIKHQDKTLILEVRDNQELLFNDVKNSAHLQVKNPRNQLLLINDLMNEIYQSHLQNINYLVKENKINNKHALFISKRSGNPLTGKQYYSKFMKVKKALLSQLSQEESIQDYLLLSENCWSTHIGRGVFTNFLLDIGLNVTQVAIARGDKNINSSLAYVDERTAIATMGIAINSIREAYQETHKTLIQKEHIEYWKDVK
ncbi:hypothetical protein QJ133_10060 [Priestia megaterium]|uniref:hypothetical protein n=1 Tax=Priestia megaterium TaxID=1404 RepID=UPI00249A7E88|nr:hypothetical protein [Priestia megaterium]MDI3091473.1 hypothetical protein [Priestia megaterium]